MTTNDPSGSRVLLTSRKGDADHWRQRVEGELRSRGLLARGLSDGQVVVVIVGPRFTQGLQPAGKSSQAAATVHKQLKQAFDTNKIVIPILVDGARMPKSRVLPADIQRFSFQQALVIESDRDLPGVIAQVMAAARIPTQRQLPQDPGQQPERSVFISYRRDDTAYWARQLSRSLALKLGPKAVFFDEGSEQPGLDFRDQIEDFLYQCTDVAVVIGAGFLEPDARGVRRIDQPNDYVRREIRTALSLQKQLHLVLIGKAQKPSGRQLPADITELAKVQSIATIKSKADVDPATNHITRPLLTRDGLGRIRFGLSPLLTRTSSSSYDTLASSVLDRLAEYGWNAENEAGGRTKQVILVNGRFSDYRLILQVDLAEIALEERVRSALRLGLGRWVQRAIFPISPHTPDDLEILQLPDRLLEAALDPQGYLDRNGRLDLKRGEQPPLRPDRFFKILQDYVEPNAEAIEIYQHQRRKLTSKGKLGRLVLDGQFELPDKAEARVIAVFPGGGSLVTGTDRGVLQFLGQDWRVRKLKGGGSYQTIDISPAGHIAACSDDGSFSLWNSNGTVIADSVSPYSWWRRISSEPWIRSLSWSPQGNLLASCDHDAIWIYILGQNEFIRWNYPVEQEMNSEYGTKYSPNGRELVVFAYGSYLWVLDARNGDVRRSVKLPSPPSRLFSSRLQPQKPPEGPAFYDFRDVDINPQGNILACAGSDGQIMLYDYVSLDPLQILVGHEPLSQGFPTRIDKVAFSHDGRRMASYGSDKRLVVWDAGSWEPIREAIVDWFVFSSRRVMDWYPDGSRIIGCADDGTLQVWRL